MSLYFSGDGVPVAQPLFQVDGDGAIPISPLQFKFISIDVPTAIELNRFWHSKLPNVVPSNIYRTYGFCYAAEFDNRFYACAIWSMPVARMIKGNVYELRRLAISELSPKNTASRFISWMVKDIKKRFPELDRLISYQDTEVHSGTIYKASGWEISGNSVGGEWTRTSRKRNPSQATAPKVRWEKQLK